MSVPGNRISVLYVDDDQVLLNLAKEFLERNNPFTVDTLQSSTEALNTLAKQEYDCIISDYQMPDMDGIALLKSVRSRYPNLPFILFTGKGREEVVIEAINAGADYYVQKGTDIRSQFLELGHKLKLAVEKRHVEMALRESEERYRNVVEGQTEFICRFRPDGTHVFVNDAYCRYFGMPKENIIGRRFVPSIPECDDGIVRLHFASLSRENPAGTIEHRIVLPDGSLRWHQWSDRAIFDKGGALHEYQSVGRDITDRKTAEEDLRKKNEELYAAYEQLTAVEEELRTSYDDLAKGQRELEAKEATLDAIIQESPIPQFVIDRNHRILNWNRALAVFSGVTAEEVTGTGRHWKAFYAAPHPCLADLLVDNATEKIPAWYGDKCIRSPLIEGAFEATDFFPGIGKDGKWLHFLAGPIRDRNGEVIGAVETLEDVTELRRREDELFRNHEELNASYELLAATEEELRQNYDEIIRKEQELRESEERYRNVVEDQTEFICRFRPDGTHVFVNDAYCRYFQKERDKIIGKGFIPALPAEDREAVRRHFASLTVRHPVGEIRHRIIMPDGGVRWQRWSDRAIFDADGTVLEYQSVGRDITDVIAAEEMVRESEERYRRFFRTSGDCVYITTPGGDWIDLNDAAVTLFGYQGRDELMKVNMADLYARRNDRKEHIRLIAEHGYLKEYPVDLRRRDGTVVPTLITSVALYDAGGNITGFQGTIRDTTAQRQAEAALRESEERYRNVVEDQTEFICRFRPDGTHVFVNDAYCRYFGRRREEILGQRFVPQVPEEDRPIVRDHFASLTVLHPVATVEHRIVMPDGTVRWQQWSDRAIFDHAGLPVEYQSVGRDVTDRKLAEAALRDANTKLQLLSSITRHDIQNQLTALMTDLDLLAEALPGKAFSGRIARAEKTAATIGALIAFTKEYGSLGQMAPEWHAIDDIHSRIAARFDLQDVCFTINYGGPAVYADPLFERVFYNIVDNALRYGEHVTEIRLMWRTSPDSVILVCEDNGVGISGNEKERIFERGYGRNTGLGLFLAREILSITGMMIRETGEPGKGARFEILVPKGAYRFTGAQGSG